MQETPNYPNLVLRVSHESHCDVYAPADGDAHLDAQREELVCTCRILVRKTP